MKFEVDGVEEWYEGMVSSYNMITGKYGVYFPSDGQTGTTGAEIHEKHRNHV